MVIKQTVSNATNANTAIGNNRRIILTKPIYQSLLPFNIRYFPNNESFDVNTLSMASNFTSKYLHLKNLQKNLKLTIQLLHNQLYIKEIVKLYFSYAFTLIHSKL